MVTIQQKADLDRLLGQLNPSSEETDELIALFNALPIVGVSALGGSEVSALAADFVIFNNNAPADTGLESSTLVVGKYLVELTLLATGVTVNPDLDLKFVSSAGSAFSWGIGAPTNPTVAIKTLATVESIPVAAFTGIFKVFGILEILTTPGTIKLQAAQALAQSENTIVNAGSAMKITRII